AGGSKILEWAVEIRRIALPAVRQERLQVVPGGGDAGAEEVRRIKPHHVTFDEVESAGNSQEIGRLCLERRSRQLEITEDRLGGEHVLGREVPDDTPVVALQLHVAGP